MIIFKNNYWQSNDQFPDFDYTRYTKVYDNESSSLVLKEKEDYIESDNPVTYVIPDDSLLTYKVMQYAPNMKVITDENGIVIDVIEDFSLEDLIKMKWEEINNACAATIKAGIDYNDEHYDLTEQDQTNLFKLQMSALNGVPGLYHSKGNSCRLYSAEEILGIANVATEFIQYQLTYCNQLHLQIKSMTDKEAIKTLKYGDELDETRQNILNQLMEEVQNVQSINSN